MALEVVSRMGVKRLEDLIAFQRAVSFKLSVYRVVRDSEPASRDLKFRSQLLAAASSTESCVVEGWHRHKAGEMAQFLRYARASAAEADMWLRDGVARGYFTCQQIQEAQHDGRKALAAITNLWKSLQPFINPRR